LALESLFHLVTDQVGCSMAVLTGHRSHSEQPDVLAVSHMAEPLAHRIAGSIHQAAASGDWRSEAMALGCVHVAMEPEHLAEYGGIGGRITFICQVEPTCFLALSVCQTTSADWSARTSAAQKINGWVEAHLRLFWRLSQDRDRADALTQVLDLFNFGAFLLDSDGNIIFSNLRAQQLLECGEGLRRMGHSLTATDFDNAVRLQTAIHHRSHNGHYSASETNGASLILIHRTNARPLVAVIARLSDARLEDSGAATAVYVLAPDVNAGPLATALCRAYGLTMAETGLVMRLLEGLTVDAAARDMHIQPQTARAYLKQIFAKTDTHRQTDLVRLILGGVVHIRPSAPPPPPPNGGNESSHLRAGQAPVWG
jgi:DNA-binding CsgD family transcriptional regulator/PAS domain-containing protein